MLGGFLYHLRAAGLHVSVTEWLTLIAALVRGHARCNLPVLYHLARALLVKRESQYDLYDRAFAEYFQGVETHFQIDDDLLAWLANPILPRALSEEEKRQLQALDFESLRAAFEERLAAQRERHDGGSFWIGTGGTSPFGSGGFNPAGIRVGGAGGGRSAVQVAGERRFRNLRSDRVLDTRQLGVALRRLRRLTRERGPQELDLDGTIDKSARNGGEIDLVFAPPRQNNVKLLLLMDVGGSMDPHAELCERLFSAAHAASHFKSFRTYYFHNCIYRKLYSDMERNDGLPTDETLKQLDATWSVVLVGDAWMSPYELTHAAGTYYDYYQERTARPGLWWLEQLRARCPHSVWLNPEPRHIWTAPSVQMVHRIFPMFELTLDGLTEAVNALRSGASARTQ